MKIFGFLSVLFILMLSLSVNAFGQNTASSVDIYDAEMAKRVGADDRGMKQYVFAILRVGKTKRPEGKEMEALQAGHMKNIMKLDDEGKLSLAGPFMDEGDLRGLFIFNVKTVEEAKKLVEERPAYQRRLPRSRISPVVRSRRAERGNQVTQEAAEEKDQGMIKLLTAMALSVRSQIGPLITQMTRIKNL